MKIMKMHNAKYLIREGFHNLWTNRTMTLASVAVLISCLLLTGAAMLFSQNMGTAMKKLEGSNSITVYAALDCICPYWRPSRWARRCARLKM